MVAKQAAPRISFGTLVLAALVVDILLFTFILTGTEAVQFRTSVEPAVYYVPFRVAFSHSFVTTALLAVAAAAVCSWQTRSRWAAAVLGLTMLSHWVLDLFTHPVLPVSPGRLVYLGSTLARWPAIALAFEAAIWIGALFLYVRDSRSVNSAGRYAFWGGVVSWTSVSWANVAGPPRQAAGAPIQMLIVLGLIVVWAFWMNRARRVS